MTKGTVLAMYKLPIENNHLEYKEAGHNKLPKDIWESVSSFANTDGGIILLGVKEVTKNKEFIPAGLLNPNKLKIDFLNMQNDTNIISKQVVKDEDIKVKKINDITILVIRVPKVSYKNRPIFLKNHIDKTYVRDHEADRLVSEEQLRYFIRESSSNIDSELLNNFNLKDLNIIDLQNYRALMAENTEINDELEYDYDKFLESIGLIQRDPNTTERKSKLNKAALLLFGKFNSIITIFPNFFLDFIIKPNANNVDYEDRIYTSSEKGHPQNIFSFFNQVSSKIESHIKNKFELKGMTRKDSSTNLLTAIREGLVNTLVHADYAAHIQIKISLYNNYIQFDNPGEMRVSSKRFMVGGVSEARNPIIFSAFMRAKLGEHTGSGGPRIYQTADKLKLRLPEIESDVTNTQLKVWTIPRLESVLTKMPEEWQPTYKYMSKHLMASYSALSHMYKSSYEGHKILNEMVKAKLINKTGKNKGTKYLLSRNEPELQMHALEYIRRLEDNLLKK